MEMRTEKVIFVGGDLKGGGGGESPDSYAQKSVSGRVRKLVWVGSRGEEGQIMACLGEVRQ